jgi:ABC-type polar amino acid transport system ATPase subunit
LRNTSNGDYDVISIRNLRKLHGERAALDRIDVDVEPGETVAIIGPSGGGKSTLLRCLNALESFDEGSIRIAGFNLAPRGGGTTARDLVQLRTAVGMVFQELNLFAHLTTLENITLAPRVVRGVSAEAANRAAQELLERVGLADRAGAYPHELSGGQKQRVAIVRALVQEPKVLLLDEPTSALDPETASGVARTISELTHGRVTVVIVTHHRTLAETLADRVLLLEAGKLSAPPGPSTHTA